MPNYTFRDPKTNKTHTVSLSMAEHDEYIEKNPHLVQVLSASPLLDPYHLGRQHAPGGFRNILKRMKKRNRGSTIDSGNLGEI